MLRHITALAICLSALDGALGFGMAPGGTPLLARPSASSMIASRSSGLRQARGLRQQPLSLSMEMLKNLKGEEIKLPKIIQGGMGVQVSSWQLARAVAKRGELGIISGTAMEVVAARHLQDGDPGGHYRRALADFPDQDMAQRFIEKYFIEGGKGSKPYKPIPMWQMVPSQDLLEATVLGNYCEVWLAKHEDDGTPIDGIVGINCLTKIQLPTIPSLYGAMYGNADYVIMGAGIPMEVPGILDSLENHEDCKLAIDVEGSDTAHYTEFSPKKFWAEAEAKGGAGAKAAATRKMQRPNFFPIVASVVLAQSLLKRATGKGPTRGIQGFVIELPTAGGHNAPPRGFRYDAEKKSHALSLNDKGEPIYGPKDEVNLDRFRDAVKGLPFFLAGYYSRPEKLQEVLSIGGAGIQVGTHFAMSHESGLLMDTKKQIYDLVQNGDVEIYTDPVASPTGFPFKVAQLEGTLFEKERYESRPRVCNLGYLRHAYMKDDGKIGYRCAAEPIDDWLKKGGDIAATVGRKCLCNGLMADAGLPQTSPFKREGEDERYVEERLITAGDDVNHIRRYLREMEDGSIGYTADDVLDYLLGRFKEEYNSELNLYQDADMAEDPEVKKELVNKKKELEGKIAEVDEQLAEAKDEAVTPKA